MNWAGIYHSRITEGSFGVQFRDNWGYILILVIMFVERFLQTKLY